MPRTGLVAEGEERTFRKAVVLTLCPIVNLVEGESGVIVLNV